MSRSLIIAALLCLLASTALAQDGRRVVHAGRLIDVLANISLLEHVAAVIKGGQRVE